MAVWQKNVLLLGVSNTSNVWKGKNHPEKNKWCVQWQETVQTLQNVFSLLSLNTRDHEPAITWLKCQQQTKLDRWYLCVDWQVMGYEPHVKFSCFRVRMDGMGHDLSFAHPPMKFFLMCLEFWTHILEKTKQNSTKQTCHQINAYKYWFITKLLHHTFCRSYSMPPLCRQVTKGHTDTSKFHGVLEG